VPRLDLALASRFVLALAILIAVSHYAGVRIAEALLPLFRAEIEALQDNYRIRVLEVAALGSDRAVRVEVGIARITALGGKVLDDNPRNRIEVTTLATNTYLPALFGLSAMLVWPAARWRQLGVRLAVGLPLLAFIVLVDVPLVLLGGIQESLLEAAGAREFSPLVAWQAFMQAGGRYALAIAATVIGLTAGAPGR
jgi:hypothetical protein